jgi:hypothetical protein
MTHPASLAGYCVRLIIPRQYGGEPLAVRSTRAQHLTDAIALHGCLVQFEAQARPFGRHQAAVLQRRHAL